MRELEITQRMARQQLLGLLDASSPTRDERIAAESSVSTVDLDDELGAPPIGFVVHFDEPPPLASRARFAVMAISFVASLAAGVGLAMLT